MQSNPSLRDSDRLEVFVSHIWERSDAYEQLMAVLKQLFGTALVDHSIPKAAALRLMSSGPQALEEEKSLHQAHIAAVTSEISLERHRQELQIEQARNLEVETSVSAARADLLREIQELESQLSNSEPLFLGERGLMLKRACLERLKQQEAQLPATSDPLALKAKLQSIEAQLKRSRKTIAVLETELDDRNERLAHLYAIEDGTLHNVHNHSNVLMRAIRDPNSITRRHANLALAIYHRIRRSDVVFMLVTALDVYREWMEFESNLATDMHKPVVTVSPDQSGASPLELYRYSRIESVPIDGRHVISCLQRIFSDSCNTIIWNPGASRSARSDASQEAHPK